MEKKHKIEIKPSHEGRFTEYCKNKGHKGVTNECIEEGLASRVAAVNKMAQFSKNAKGWK